MLLRPAPASATETRHRVCLCLYVYVSRAWHDCAHGGIVDREIKAIGGPTTVYSERIYNKYNSICGYAAVVRTCIVYVLYNTQTDKQTRSQHYSFPGCLEYVPAVSRWRWPRARGTCTACMLATVEQRLSRSRIRMEHAWWPVCTSTGCWNFGQILYYIDSADRL